MIILIISHRGNNKHLYKENSKEAILNVLKQDYIDGVEFDIRLTKDKKFVLNHSLLSDGKIIKYNKVDNLNLDELNSVLKKIHSKKILIIEIKDNDLSIVDLLYKIIKKYQNLNIYIHTFHKDLAILFKQKYPKIIVGLILFNINALIDYSLFDFISLHYLGYQDTKKVLFLWTINTKDKIKKFNSMNIITDKPFLAK